jgi:hypothetical protein
MLTDCATHSPSSCAICYSLARKLFDELDVDGVCLHHLHCLIVETTMPVAALGTGSLSC